MPKSSMLSRNPSARRFSRVRPSRCSASVARSGPMSSGCTRLNQASSVGLSTGRRIPAAPTSAARSGLRPGQVHGLGDEVVRAELEGLHHDVAFAVAGDHGHRQLARRIAQRISRSTSRPSIIGRVRSSSTRWGRSDSMSLRASGPSPLVQIRNPRISRRRASIDRLVASSSTIRMVGVCTRMPAR